MALKKALVALCLGSAAAFNPRAKATAKAVTKQVAAGVLAAAAALPVAPALAADSLVLGTPLEEKLAAVRRECDMLKEAAPSKGPGLDVASAALRFASAEQRTSSACSRFNKSAKASRAPGSSSEAEKAA